MMPDSGWSTSTRVKLIGALLVFLIGVGRYWAVIDQPYDGTVYSQAAVGTGGVIARLYRHYGFWELRGAPVITSVPPKETSRFLYLNHPPLPWWLYHAGVTAFGLTERGLRSVPILFSAATAAVLFWWLARRTSLWTAAAGAALFLGCEIGFAIGTVSNNEPPTVFFSLLAMCLWDLRRDHDRPRIWPTGIALFLGLWCDWIAGFAGVTIAVMEIAQPADRRRFRDVCILGIVAAAAVVSVLLLFRFWVGSFDFVFKSIRAGASKAAAENMVESRAAWFAKQWTMLTVGFSKATILATAAAVVAGLTIFRRDRTVVAAMCAIIPGVLNIFAFTNRAWNHDYWWYIGCPGIVMTLAVVAHQAAIKKPWIAAAILALFAADCVRSTIKIEKKKMTTVYRDFGRGLMSKIDADDVVVAPNRFVVETFYSKPWLLGIERGPLPPKEAVDEIRRNLDRPRRIIVILEDAYATEYPDFAAAVMKEGQVVELPALKLVVIEKDRR